MNRRHFLGIAAALMASPAFAGEPVLATGAKTGGKDNNAFAIGMYKELSKGSGNVFFSPYSINSAMGMAYAGARGETAKQIRKALSYSLEGDQLHAALGQLNAIVNDEKNKKRGYQLTNANALWAREGYPFAKRYADLTSKYYRAGVHNVDFRNATEGARKTINEWVEKKTNDKIKELLKKGTITPDTALVLTNAIYFKGDWALQFKKDRTRDAQFKTAPSKTVKVKMMNQTEKFGYLDAPNLQVLEMPYKGKELSMVVLLPKKVDGLAALEKNLTAAQLGGWMGKIRSTKVIFGFPKFETTCEYGLKPALRKLGMPIAFSDAADFSGINDGKAESLSITDVVHKAYVKVDEKGTEAAAATGIVFGATSAPILPSFRADHPFLFLIRDKRTDSILFMGRMTNPAK